MAVLLIGSTGNGKSALGNFLLDPDNIQLAGKHFEVANDNLPKTQQTKAEKAEVTFQHWDEDTTGSVPEEHQSTEISEGEITEGDVLEEVVDVPDGDGDYSKAESDYSTDAGGKIHGKSKFNFANLHRQLKVMGSEFSSYFTQMLIKTKDLTVIDTPGLNESPKKDLEHMIDLVTNLQKLETIQACIFVVKFDTKIDQQYKDTIEYYSRLRPSLFGNNSIIVMTHYFTDRRSVAMREQQGINYDVIIYNVKKEIIKSSGICYEPMIFALDCIPLEGEQEELTTAKGVRDAILSYIFSQRAINTKEMQLAKTKSLLEGDKECINTHEEDIKNYTTRLKEANEGAAAVLDIVRKKEGEVTAINNELVVLEDERREKDSNGLVTAASWSVNDKFKWFKWQTKEFDIESKWDISEVEKWANTRCRWQNMVRKPKKVHGVLKGNFMRGLYASITLKTRKKLQFAGEIAKLNGSIEEKKEARTEAGREMVESRNQQKDAHLSIKFLQDFIEEKRERIKTHAGNLMTLEEAKSQLEKYQE